MSLDVAKALQEAVCTCSKCGAYAISRPFCEFNVYEKYLPVRVRKLIVSESPPPGDKPDFLYNLQHFDRLRSILAKILQVQEQVIPELLRERGIFWTMAIKCRPRHKTVIRHMWRQCTHILKLEIELLKPEEIIALGRTAQEALKALNIQPSYSYYHPLYIYRFRRDLIESLRQLILH